MLRGILSPYFLQAAGRVGKPIDGVVLFTTAADPTLTSVSCEQISVISIKNGEKHIDTYENLSDAALSISADANTKIIIEGGLIGTWNMGLEGLTKIVVNNTSIESIELSGSSVLQTLEFGKNAYLRNLDISNCPSLQTLDLRKVVNLEDVACDDCTALQVLDFSKCPLLTNLYAANCPSIKSIYYLQSPNPQPITAIVGLISNADATDGVIYTDASGETYTTIETTATAKGWTIEPLLS